MAQRAATVKTPISTTNPERPSSQRHNPNKRTQKGFTLIELLVVLAIGALLVGLVPSAFDKLRESSQYRDTVRAIVTDLRQARQQAQVYGLLYGVAVSCGPTSSRTIAGFGRSDREYTDAEIVEIADLVRILHRETEPPERLSTPQVDALRLVSKGFRHSEAAHRLGISESALKARLRSARDRLLSRTTAEAIQRAIEAKLL